MPRDPSPSHTAHAWRKLLVTLGLLVAAQAARSQETPAAVADRLLSATPAELRTLAAVDEPDPWLVVEDLCVRGRYEIAKAFANAAPRADTKALPAYVASRRAQPTDAAVHAQLTKIDVAVEAGDPDTALATLDELQVKEESVAAVRVHLFRGLALRAKRRGTESTAAFVRAADAAQKLGWLGMASTAISHAGNNHLTASNLRSALQMYQRKLTLDKSRGSATAVASSLLSIGTVHVRRRSVREAYGALRRALRVSTKVKDQLGIARAHEQLGGLFLATGELPRALDHLKQALETAEATGDEQKIGFTLNALGRFYSHTGKHKEACSYYERSLALLEKRGDQRNASVLLRNLGNTHNQLGNLRKAIEFFTRSLELSRSLAITANTAAALVGLGEAHRALGDYPLALAHLEEARELLEPRDDRATLCAVLSALGKVRRARGELAKSLVCLRRSLKLAESLRSPRLIAQSSAGLADTLWNTGALTEALRHQQRSFKTFEQLGDRGGMASRLDAIGTVHQYRGDLKQARSYYTRALKIAKAIGDRSAIAASLGNLGSTYKGRRAIEYAEQALALRRALGDRASVAMALVNLGSGYLHVSDHERAAKHLEHALRLAREIGHPLNVTHALSVLSRLHASKGDYRAALDYAKRHRKLCEDTGDRFSAARSLRSLSSLYLKLGRYDDALDCLERAQAATSEIGKRDQIVTLLSVGHVYKMRRDPRRALTYYENAMRIAESLEGPPSRQGKGLVHHAMGLVFDDMAAYAKALHHIEQARVQWEHLGLRNEIATELHNLGNLHWLLGNSERAERLYEQCVRETTAIGQDPTVTLSNLANIYESRGDLAGALSCYERSLARHEQSGERLHVGADLLSIGRVRSSLGEHRKADDFLQRSRDLFVEIGDPVAVARATLHLGLSQRAAGNRERALELFEQARSGAVEGGAARVEVAALQQLATTFCLLGRFEDAKRCARLGIERLPLIVSGLAQEQGAQARTSLHALFDSGLEACLGLEEPAGALFFMESSRAGALLESLGGARRLAASLIPAELRDAERAARASLTAAQTTLRSAQRRRKRKEVRSAKAALETENRRLLAVIARIQRATKAAANVTYPKPASLGDIQSLLAAGDALVTYSLTPTSCSALVVTRETAELIPNLKPGKAPALHDATAPWAESVKALRSTLIEPLGLDDGIKRLLVSPAGGLAYLPFAVLCPDLEIAYVPSGTTYRVLLDEREKRGTRVLALGDPDYGAHAASKTRTITDLSKLTPLPETRAEALAIGDKVLLGEQATESAFRGAVGAEQRWRAIHLACHGLLNSARPQLNALAVTSDDRSDGLLTMYEIAAMKLPADLVVLSACDTARGKVYRAEGVVGFTQAFMLAGAPRVIASLWKVDDQATRALMVKFYELWNPGEGKGSLSAAAALARAQRFVAGHEKWRHPYYWAAWQLWGLPD